MCGIIGIVKRDGLSEQDCEYLRYSTLQMQHRGPDGDGIWIANGIGLGHRRLSIIDLNSGAQPMQDTTTRYTITYNGEIYNYKELRHLLEAQGYVFRTDSDTEVILNAYAHWGTGCVERFNGIFAFGLWDSHEQSLFLARDHLGIKPLIYHANRERLIFGSELKSILHYPPLKPELDLCSVSDYLSLGYILSPKTIIQDVHKLQPGSWLIWKDGDFHVQRFWDLASVVGHTPLHIRSAEQAAEALKEQLERAVRMQLVSDVPLGAFLSGGLDSSTVVQKMISTYPDRLKTFSIGFKEESYSELPFAQLVSDYLGTKHFTEVISPDINELLPKLAWYFDEPFSDTSAIPTYILCQLARRHAKVSLSGDGGDECFAGYETYLADLAQSLYSRVPSTIHRLLVAPLADRLPSTHRKVSWDYKLKQFVAHARSSPEKAHYSWRLIFNEDEKQMLLGEEKYRQLNGYTPFETFMDYYREIPNASALNRSLYVDIKTWLADDILVKADRASMAHGLEVRVPLLDYQLVEFAMSLPSHYKLRGWQTKALLKQSMTGSLPRNIIHRAKRGFNAPVAHWVQNFSPKMLEYRTGELPGLSDMWVHLMDQHVGHRADNGFKLWSLLMWFFWDESVLKKGFVNATLV